MARSHSFSEYGPSDEGTAEFRVASESCGDSADVFSKGPRSPQVEVPIDVDASFQSFFNSFFSIITVFCVSKNKF